jgi:hypothetical protein
MGDIQDEEVSEERAEGCAKVHVEEAQMIFNTFLDDVITNTHAFIQLKPDLPQWRNKDELFDLGIINKESHRQAIENIKTRWFSMYLQQEQKWAEKIKGYKQQLEDTRKLIQQTTEIAFEGIYNREPPRCYSLFLHDRWAVFILRQLAADNPTRSNNRMTLSVYIFLQR